MLTGAGASQWDSSELSEANSLGTYVALRIRYEMRTDFLNGEINTQVDVIQNSKSGVGQPFILSRKKLLYIPLIR